MTMRLAVRIQLPAVTSLLLIGLGFGAAGCRRSDDAPAGPSAPIVEAMNRGVSLMGQYQYDPAAAAFQEVLRADPKLAEANVNLAIALFNRNRKEDRDLDTASQLLDEVLTAAPGHLRALYFKGILLQHFGKAEEAVRCFEQVVQQRPQDGAAWYMLGLCKERIGQPAEPELLKALEHRPYLFSACYKLFQIASRQENDAKAKEYLAKFTALRESPLGESIELPQYNQMGDLALARPLPATPAARISQSHYEAGPAQPLFDLPGKLPGRETNEWLGGIAAGDVSQDGLPDLVVPSRGGRDGVNLWLHPKNLPPDKAGTASGLAPLTHGMACALGDFDNDDIPDLFIAGAGTNALLRGKGDGTFDDVTRASGIGSAGALSRSALFLDADHDADLDIFVCNFGFPDGRFAPNELWNNNGDGTFTNIAFTAGVACADSRSVMVLPGDLDGDRDLDLVVLCEGRPARIFFNDLLGHFTEATASGADLRGDLGGVLQDFNGDGRLDLLVLGGQPPALNLFLGDGRGRFQPSPTFAESSKAAASWGPISGLRAADFDLDGDLDVALFGSEGHLLLNDGQGRFVLQDRIWKPAAGAGWLGVEVCDFNGDFVPDVLLRLAGSPEKVVLVAGKLTPPATALAVQPTGLRGRDKRTRSPASGYGVSMTARRGLHEQRVIYTGLNGGPSQSWLPAVLGLGGARQADYLDLLWPDGVAQVDRAVAAGQSHKIGEVQRKLSSCPVLFAWNGERFAFVTDFAGVGGLGYFAAPGVTAPPHVLEHVKIEPAQLRSKAGFYELRVTEPMEEVAYVDRLELLAVDHPAGQPVFPDERLALNGPPPTHELLVVEQMIFPVKAMWTVEEREASASSSEHRPLSASLPMNRTMAGRARCPHRAERMRSPWASPAPARWGHRSLPGSWPQGAVMEPWGLPMNRTMVRQVPAFPEGEPTQRASEADADCAERLARVDRIYAYEPPLDRRYLGFCRPHTLELDFGDRLAAFNAEDNVFLFIHGFIEYPYSQTTYAASQSRVGWEPIRVERWGDDGRWQTLVPDAGAPGGMARMMTVDLSGKLSAATRKLRLTTNLEIYYDQIFMGRHAGLSRVNVQSVPLVDAVLRNVGFAREYSPDGRLPLIYDYDSSDPTAPFHVLRGAYTRYGQVKDLLRAFDDQYVLVGPGDEVALRFDASKMPPVPAGRARSFILVSHAYCKDMDLYTATPQTVEPLPFRGMSRYPYPDGERYPVTPQHQAYRKAFNTRVVE